MSSATPDPPSTTPPDWPHCAHGATAGDPVGCRGRRIPDRTACLAHLTEADRAATTGHPRLGNAWFTKATFSGDAVFGRATSGRAGFGGATFSGDAVFARVTFTGRAVFGGATFSGRAVFGGATFTGDAVFGGATFSGRVGFGRVTFSGRAGFYEATFSDDAGFGKATFCGDAVFSRVVFSGDAVFSRVVFSGDAGFGGATFSGRAGFGGVMFAGDAGFGRVVFSGDAGFGEATFSGDAKFGGVTFTGDAGFGGVTFAGDAGFGGVTFAGDAGFGGATFSGDAGFRSARFEAAARLGPLVCGGAVVLDGAVFGEPVTVEAAARVVTCDRTRWASAATLRLRHAEVDLTDAVLEYPLTVAARPTPFTSWGDSLPETPLSGSDPGVRLTSLDGVDAAHLVLNDIDLSACRFAGAVHLDQLRVDGWCTFATTPTGVRRHRLLPRWWSLRSTLAEEHHWRARRPRPTADRGWTPPPREDTPVLKPAALAALYRQVRKSLEDGKNEPDAADFYYGESETRRHDTTRSRGERALLTAYWVLSGYGLRAGRALAWLLGAMAVTLLALLLWGLPVDDPKPTTTGRQVAVGQEVTWTTDTPDPVNPTGPWPERVTTERFEKALRVVINSVVFRSSGQDLTTAGTYTEMASRLAEPVLLGLAVLAIRSRVKR
ncbi:pentapeptide repeat-containing protein [Streptomyces sp. S07_1.15]|uniref:pentapeptide repeat-containing protein n=1 Tax=Streptomyces sp. S07_1.15 TaxID=2873925 RepID=UPI001D1384A2|nr:pentapeptide repeat-containing protein [Streptomyces sp. S07_1.15]MCC3655012.1 pentapeptide repeat-containing protein [Streptomyces sp. S07_1.15]